MPDWSYRTLFRPLLFSLSAENGRDLALGAMGRLSRLPLGPLIIDLFGHMHPDQRLQRHAQGLTLPSPVGVGHLVDPHGTATQALARFGVGLIEVGPIAVRRLVSAQPLVLEQGREAIVVPALPVAHSVTEWVSRLSTLKRYDAKLLARLTVDAGASPEQATDECATMLGLLAPHVDGFVLATADEALRAGWTVDHWRGHLQLVREASRLHQFDDRVWVAIPADLNARQLEDIVGSAVSVGLRGVIVDGRKAEPGGGFRFGRQALDPVQQTLGQLRSRYGEDLSLIAGGAHEPLDAIQLRQLGADCVVVDAGMIYSGPGLPKRINEAVLYSEMPAAAREAATRPASTPSDAVPVRKLTWFWASVLGAAMLLGGLLAFGIAATRVILPYDEVFVGMSREDLNLINPRLMAFMQHDRISLAGTMLAIAVLYVFLAWCGIRRGAHWAMVSVLVSAFIGFVSFFLFLGFGYFDPFHAFVTAIMFQFLLMAWTGDLTPPEFTSLPNLRETPAWRWAQWGQLIFVIHGAGLVGAGMIIAAVGCTSVFVREDLQFMDVCPSDLSLANPRLIPLIAHDRASFGGMLITTGLAVLMTALWGFREGCRWQWWMLLLAGVPAYVMAIGIHIIVGYTNWWHLLPAYGGLSLLTAGLVCMRPYLIHLNPESAAEWERIRGTVRPAIIPPPQGRRDE